MGMSGIYFHQWEVCSHSRTSVRIFFRERNTHYLLTLLLHSFCDNYTHFTNLDVFFHEEYSKVSQILSVLLHICLHFKLSIFCI